MVSQQMRHLSLTSDGFRTKVEIDGQDISSHVTGILLRHDAGDVPRCELQVVEPEHMNWQGDAYVSIVFKCPVCSGRTVCEHDGNCESAGIADTTSLADATRRFIDVTSPSKSNGEN